MSNTGECIEQRQLVSLNKVISAALVDTYADINQAGVQQMYAHWAARGYKKLNNEVLKIGKRKVILTVNPNTHTATLPLDFYHETFVGVIDNFGQRVPIRMRGDLIDYSGVEEIEPEEDCPKCGCNKNICKDLSITESSEVVILNNTTYIKTIVKTLYPNGDYMVETNTPVYNFPTPTPEVPALAYLLVTHIGSAGAKAELFISGVSLGTYIQGDGITDTDTLAAAMALFFDGKNGYQFESAGSQIVITNTPGVGSAVNNQTTIVLTLTQINTGGGGLGTQHPALAFTITQFSGGVDAVTLKDGTVTYVKQKEFIAKLSMTDCGCIAPTPENIEVIKTNAYDCYCCYYAPCCNNTLDAGYQIFEETGLIKFGRQFKQKKVYIEYQGFLPKKNGQYQIPEIAFECLVNWVKFKSVENKKNVPLNERNWYRQMYLNERGNMEKMNGRMSFQQVLQAFTMIPKFDAVSYNDWHQFGDQNKNQNQLPAPAADNCNVPQNTCPPVSGKTFTPFNILTVAGNGQGTPVVGTNTFQDDRLKGAIGIDVVFIDNTTLSRYQNDNQGVKDFSIDTISGTISFWQGDGTTPRNWFGGEVLIIPTFFKLV